MAVECDSACICKKLCAIVSNPLGCTVRGGSGAIAYEMLWTCRSVSWSSVSLGQLLSESGGTSDVYRGGSYHSEKPVSGMERVQ
eukprot:4350114-Amphidinium_carterae.1